MPLRISQVQQFEQHKDGTWDLHFSLDGNWLVSSDGKAIYLWRRDDRGSWQYERSLPFSGATFPRFAPDGKTLAFGSVEKFVRLISVDGKELATFPTPSHASWALSPDERWLVSSSTGRSILLWDLTTYQSTPIPVPFPALYEAVTCLRFTPDGQRLVFGISSTEGYVHICYFDPGNRGIMLQKNLPIDGIITSAIAPNGKMLAILDSKRGLGPYETEVFVYDLESFQLLQKLPRTTEGEGRYSLLIFSPDSQFLMSSKDDGMVDIWSLATFECVASFAAHPGLTNRWADPIGGLDWSSTGYIATGGAAPFEKDELLDDFSIKMWKVEL